jgi:hypothetical protein
VELTPAAATLLRLMATRQPPQLNLAMAAEETDLPVGVVGNAMVALCEAKLAEHVPTPAEASGAGDSYMFRTTARGMRAARRLPE